MSIIIKHCVQQIILISSVVFIVNSEKTYSIFHILHWIQPDVQSSQYLGMGHDPFKLRKCSFQNCYITSNHTFLNNVTDFDAILFDVCYLDKEIEVPLHRSDTQIYILYGLESSKLFPISERFDNFFNMTWTYRLTSDIVDPYVLVKNNHGEVVGPKIDMKWLDIDKMGNLSVDVLSKLKKKHIAAAWIASNCQELSSRDKFVKYLHKEMSKYGLQLDIYGRCGNLYCSKGENHVSNCSGKIESDYYFYLAFENFFSEDYVTEKMVYALNHFIVPIVYGGANYSRFLPDGIYLNANKLGVHGLVKEMNFIIRVPQKYYNFFKWHGYNSFHSSNEDLHREAVCGLCEMLNNRTRRSQRTVYKSLSKWWNGFSVNSEKHVTYLS